MSGIAVKYAGGVTSAGRFSVFGESDVVFPSNADYTPGSGDTGGYDALSLIVSGLSAPGFNLILPLDKGRPWIIKNTNSVSFTVKGSTGAGVLVPPNTILFLHCDGSKFEAAPATVSVPTGTGFVHITSGAQDGAARAVDVSSADVTGALALGNGGTGITSAGSAGNYLRSNGTVWASAAIQSGDLTAALASPPAIGGTSPSTGKFTSVDGTGSTTDFSGSGTTLTIPALEVITGSGSKAPTRSGVREGASTLTDNTTWVEVSTIVAGVLANNTAHDVTVKIFAADFSTSSNTQISGDVVTFAIEFLATVSNAGTITLSAGITNTTTTLTLSALPGSLLSTVGGSTGGVTNPISGIRARVSSGTIIVEVQGATGKFYKVADCPQTITRLF